MSAFPNVKHYFFDPLLSDFHANLLQLYGSVKHELVEVALDEVEQDYYLVKSAIDRDGVLSHSQMRSVPAVVDGAHIIGCELKRSRRFDDLPLNRSLPKNFLLKVDVDGADSRVLRGFGSSLCDASLVIVESTVGTLVERLRLLADSGFRLIDICDQVLYEPSLYQVDLVFARSDLVHEGICPDIRSFDRQLWRPR